MSWVEHRPLNDTDEAALKYVRFRNNTWGPVLEVASGQNWFVNWADFPGVQQTKNGMLIAHWLQYSAASTYAYDIKTVFSADGKNWSAPSSPHRDGTPTEHGFVSYFTVGNYPALVWLDGRLTLNKDGHDGHSNHGGGAMTLRMANSPDANHWLPSELIDERVCDCCQTSAVDTPSGPVIVYRDRTENEIRDISYVKFSNNQWSQPQSVHADGWQISGCPVNGPQVDANNGLLATAWFTAAEGRALVKLAISPDDGQQFSAPVIVSGQKPLGRVDLVVLNKNLIAVVWLEDVSGGIGMLKLGFFNRQGDLVSSVEIAGMSGSRSSGFPRMARLDDANLLLAWTDTANNARQVRTARISINH